MVDDIIDNENLRKLFIQGAASLTPEEKELYLMWLFHNRTGIHIQEFFELHERIKKRSEGENVELVQKLDVLYREGEAKRKVKLMERNREVRKRWDEISNRMTFPQETKE